MPRLLAVGALCLSTISSASVLTKDMKNIQKKKWQRLGLDVKSITLKNKMKVQLIADPKANSCAASLGVGVGSFDDPLSTPGLIHYLEHMLFMGTKKYPEVDGFSKFVDNNGGSYNAGTYPDRTIYTFSIQKPSFPEALDRFSQFFISPLFDPIYLEKEKKAVDSEHQANIKNDGRRFYRMTQSLYKPEHPGSTFSTGSSQTLKKVTRAQVVKAYEDHYSANLMALAMTCNETISKMEKMATTMFSAIKNRNLPPNNHPFSPHKKTNGGKRLEIKPVTERRSLTIHFPMPPHHDYYMSSPLTPLSFIINRKGKGSLHEALTKQNLVSSVDAYYDCETFTCDYFASFALTPEGETKQNDIVKTFFAYVKFLQKAGYPKSFYDFLATTGRRDYIFNSKPSPYRMSLGAAYDMLSKNNLSGLEGIVWKYSEKDFLHFLSYLKPDTATVMLLSKTANTGKKELYYGIEFGEHKVSAKDKKSWKSPPPIKSFSYPPQNPYIGDDDKIHQSDSKTSPYLLVDRPDQKIYFLQDKQFGEPKAYIQVRLLNRAATASEKAHLTSVYYNQTVDRYLEEWDDELTDAGIYVDAKVGPEGLTISANGYSQFLFKVLEELMAKLQAFQPNPGHIAIARDSIKRQFASIEKLSAADIATENLEALSVYKAFHYDHLNKVQDKVSIKDIENLISEFKKPAPLIAVAYGNLDPKETRKALTKMFKPTNLKLPRHKDWGRTGVLFPKGKPLAYHRGSKNNNNAFVSTIHLGKRNPRTEAVGRILESAWHPELFTELRTEKQMGYQVQAAYWPGGAPDISGLTFFIQSESHTPSQIGKEVEAWTKKHLARLDKLDDKSFAKLKSGLVERYSKPSRTLQERFYRIWGGMITHEGNFHYRKDLLKQLKNLSKKDFSREVKTALTDKNLRRATIYIRKAGLKKGPGLPHEKVISDIQAFNNSKSSGTLSD